MKICYRYLICSFLTTLMLPSMGICTPTAGLGQTLLTNVNLGLGQDGEPLPPPNKDIARHWPPEIKQLVDDMLELFSRQERESLSAEQIEQKLKIKLERTPLKTDQGGVTANYNITQSIWLTLRADPPDTRSLGVYWFIEHKKTGKTHHHLELALDRDRYCLNPYELAIYTGAKYQPEPPFFTGYPYIAATDGPRYEWGMFKPRPKHPKFLAQPLQANSPTLDIRASNECAGVLIGFRNTPLEK